MASMLLCQLVAPIAIMSRLSLNGVSFSAINRKRESPSLSLVSHSCAVDSTECKLKKPLTSTSEFSSTIFLVKDRLHRFVVCADGTPCAL